MNVLIRLVSLGLILWASAGWAAPLPWKTFTKTVPDTTGSRLTACATSDGPQEVYIARLERDGDAYAFFYAPLTNRLLWLYWKGNVGGAQPDEIGTGTVDPARHDVIPPIVWRPGAEVIAQHADPCELLFPALT